MDRCLLSKASTKSSKITTRESGFNEKLNSVVRDFYYRDDNSINLPRKRDFKKVKSIRFQTSQRFPQEPSPEVPSENPEQTIPFSTFA